MDDPRQSGKVWYRLDEVLLLCLLAVLAGAEGWVEVAEFGKRKLGFLRRFRPFENGTPSSKHLKAGCRRDSTRRQAWFGR